MPTTLSGADKATFDLIYLHPISHNLEWESVKALFNHIGETEDSHGGVKISRNGQTLLVHPRGKDLAIEDIMKLRHFLKGSDFHADTNSDQASDLLVLLDHKGARIFRVDAEEATPEHVVPLDPLGHDHQVHNPKGDSGGQQGPLRHLFYESLVKHLEGANRILFLGDGRGASSEIDHFFAEVELHHPQLASRIVSGESVDISHMTDPELMAHAKEVFHGLQGA